MEGKIDLGRFRDAQEGGVFERAVAEVRAGRKTSHWMWYIYPQLRGLGRSGRARHYGIADREEAQAYAADPVLGPRLIEAMQAMLTNRGTPPEAVLGPVDALKLRSCATLFAALPGADPVFAEVLETFHDGTPCAQTLALLK